MNRYRAEDHEELKQLIDEAVETIQNAVRVLNDLRPHEPTQRAVLLPYALKVENDFDDATDILHEARRHAAALFAKETEHERDQETKQNT